MQLDLVQISGADLPVEVSAIDSFASALDQAERRLTVLARRSVSLTRVLKGEELLCDVFDRCAAVSRCLLEYADQWLA